MYCQVTSIRKPDTSSGKITSCITDGVDNTVEGNVGSQEQWIKDNNLESERSSGFYTDSQWQMVRCVEAM